MPCISVHVMTALKLPPWRALCYDKLIPTVLFNICTWLRQTHKIDNIKERRCRCFPTLLVIKFVTLPEQEHQTCQQPKYTAIGLRRHLRHKHTPSWATLFQIDVSCSLLAVQEFGNHISTPIITLDSAVRVRACVLPRSRDWLDSCVVPVELIVNILAWSWPAAWRRLSSIRAVKIEWRERCILRSLF